MKAQVAYENAREAKRKLKAVKPLRWHRLEAEGRYEAKGARGRYVLVSRSPDRRKGIFPWTVFSGGLKGPELKAGGFDLKAEAALFAAQYDAGLCGAPAVVVQAPSPEGLPPGVYRGTAAGEGGIGTLGGSDYAWQVVEALSAMGVQAPREMVASSEIYVGQMEAAHIEPATVAAVLVATKDHRHVHDCPEKHVDLAEGGAGARESARSEWEPDDHIFRGMRYQVWREQDGWVYRVQGKQRVGYFADRYQADAAARRALGEAAGFSMAVEGAAEAKRKRGVPPIFQTLQQRLDAGGYPTVSWPSFHIYYDGGDKYQSGPDARGALRNFRLEGNKQRVFKIVAVELTPDGPKDINHFDFIYNISSNDTLEETGAREGRPYAQGWHVMYLPPGEHRSKKEWFETEGEAKARLRELRASGVKGGIVESTSEFEGTNEAAEAKKRLPQPDPGSGYWITHSSLTRNLFLMKGDRLVGQYDKREDALKAAADLSSSAEETRRPKGRRHR